MIRILNDHGRILLDILQNLDLGNFGDPHRKVITELRDVLSKRFSDEDEGGAMFPDEDGQPTFPHDGTLVDFIADVMSGYGGRNVISGAGYDMIRRAILLPEEIKNLSKDMPPHCTNCGEVIRAVDLVRYDPEDRTTFKIICSRCARTGYVKCDHCEDRKLIQIPRHKCEEQEEINSRIGGLRGGAINWREMVVPPMVDLGEDDNG